MAKKKAEASTEAAAGEEAPKAKISKADAVRAALAKGIDKPEDGVAFLLKEYGIEMPNQTFSSYKSQEKARAEKKADGKPKGRPGRKPASAQAAAAPTLPPSGANGPTGLATSVEAIKVLVDQYGVEQVVQIARLFGK